MEEPVLATHEQRNRGGSSVRRVPLANERVGQVDNLCQRSRVAFMDYS